MSSFLDDIKVDLKQEEKSKSVELIIKYIEKEKELNIMFDKEDGIDVDAEDYKPTENLITIDRLKNLLSYRTLRTRQAYISKISNGDNSRKTREMLVEIDKDRRDKHNLALSSFKGLNEFAKKYGLEPLYKGKMLTEEQIDSHDPSTYDIRKDMTDAFLKILIELGNYSARENFKGAKEIETVQDEIYRVERDYGVKGELKEDDGDVVFEDEKFFPEFR